MDRWMNGIESQEINPCIYGQLILAKNTQWKQAKCPSMDKWIKKTRVCVCISVRAHIHEYYLASQKEILPFMTTWIVLKDIGLSEISQKKTNTVKISLICGI